VLSGGPLAKEPFARTADAAAAIQPLEKLVRLPAWGRKIIREGLTQKIAVQATGKLLTLLYSSFLKGLLDDICWRHRCVILV
jgi:hypothetical protein